MPPWSTTWHVPAFLHGVLRQGLESWHRWPTKAPLQTQASVPLATSHLPPFRQVPLGWEHLKPLAASAGSSVRQSKGVRSRGMPARQLPAARAAASWGGRRGSDVDAHHRRSRRRPPSDALFPGGWAALGSQRRWALQGTRARSFTALAPAPSARALRPTPLRSLPRQRH